MVGEWVVAAVSGTRSPPGRSLTTPHPVPVLANALYVRGSPGSWRRAGAGRRFLLGGRGGRRLKPPQPLTDSVVPRRAEEDHQRKVGGASRLRSSQGGPEGTGDPRR
ncbi:hypothetical protein SORBI_3009G184450 [Sorghum bicolor]|uniref:Uncharacterized protein n=1 Tax=Sorghum bicolor TaxID=4558 RepID=A0A1Z5R3D5_SORBI|nr:hypothetical protein SORBI_3009G184450 [Sorghum bicolor]